jgi:hypothetical protein
MTHEATPDHEITHLAILLAVPDWSQEQSSSGNNFVCLSAAFTTISH